MYGLKIWDGGAWQINNVMITNRSDESYLLAKEFGLGIEVHDFFFPKVMDNPQLHKESIKQLLGGIKLRSIHGPFSDLVPASCDTKIIEVCKSRFTSAFETAKELNAQHLIFHTGFIPKTYFPKDWLNNSIKFWSDFLSDKANDIEIHIENVYEDDLNLIKDLVDAVDNPKFSVCLDLGHVNANSSKTLTHWIAGLNDRIRYVHMHNNYGESDDHFGLWKGQINMLNTLESLKVHSPRAMWTIETLSDDIKPSIKWLADNGFIK